MAANLLASSFNVGRDIQLQINLNGTPYNFNWLLTDIGRKSISHLQEIIPTNTDGVAVRRVTYSGYEYDFHFTRVDGSIDALVDQLQQNYYANQTPPIVTATETITDATGVDMRQLSGGVIVPDSLGSFKGADPVNDGTFKIVFSQATPVGGTAGISFNLNNPLTYL